MSSANTDYFTYFPVWMHFFFLPNCSGYDFQNFIEGSSEIWNPILFPDIKEKAFNIPFLSMLAVGFSYMTFIVLRYVLFIPNLLTIFIVKDCERMLYINKCFVCIDFDDPKIYTHFVNVLYHTY